MTMSDSEWRPTKESINKAINTLLILREEAREQNKTEDFTTLGHKAANAMANLEYNAPPARKCRKYNEDGADLYFHMRALTETSPSKMNRVVFRDKNGDEIRPYDMISKRGLCSEQGVSERHFDHQHK